MKRNAFSATENTKVNIPLESCFVLKRPNHNVYIKDAVFPPRLCEFTDDIDEAQTFESIREVVNAAAYIKQHAWQIVATDINGVPVFLPVIPSTLEKPIPPAGRILGEGEKP
jgi:hypothetical protein